MSYVSLLLPLTAQQRTAVTLDAANVFALPNDKRERAFLIKNISFENLSPGDLFARGWHRSGYLFGIDRADVDYLLARGAPPPPPMFVREVVLSITQVVEEG
jgi:hypothetical protein